MLQALKAESLWLHGLKIRLKGFLGFRFYGFRVLRIFVGKAW